MTMKEATPAERLERMRRDQIGDPPRVVAGAKPDP
jgi:hypothetical protein